MHRSISIRVDRVEAMRVLVEAIRSKAAVFNEAQKKYPASFKKAKQEAAKILRDASIEVLKATTAKAAKGWLEPAGYQTRDRIFPSPPELNLCAEQRLLQMLKMDTRKVLPINSDHELWVILQGKCEVLR